MMRVRPEAIEMVPSPPVRATIDDVIALLTGEVRDFSTTVLDMRDVSEFNQRVYDVTRTVGPGSTTTYGEIARRLGDRSLARAVGQALGQNPFAIVVPCHRVLAADGRAGGFSAPGGVSTKVRMLEIESARTSPVQTRFAFDTPKRT